MRQILFLLILLLIPLQIVYAQEILFSVEQSEYYFKVGEEATIPIKIENSFGEQVPGMLQYTITQQINQGNVQFSNSKTNSNTFVIEDGNRTASLNFGTSDNPTSFVVNLNFNYNEGTDQTTSLGPITINFVTDDSQKNNQSNPMQSTTQSTQSSQSSSISQQRQQMQQKLDQLFGNQQMPSQDPQQRLQNNQLSQDSTALKQQIQEQLQQQEQTQKEFEKQLAANSDFANQHKKLLQNGYNATNANIKSISNKTGSFDIQYQNENGKWATLQGKMVNGTMTEITQQTQEEQEKLLEKLEQNTQYQEFKKQLTQSGFVQDNIEFQQNENQTKIIVKYQNEEHDNASIIGIFEDEQIKSVTMENYSSHIVDLFLIIVVIASIIVASIIAFLVLRKFSKKKPIDLDNTTKIHISKPFDYVTEARKIISKAKQHYDDKEYKEAFGMAGQAIRLFLRYDTDLKKEMTNEELIRSLPKEKYPINEITACLNMAELVEFAKKECREEDFLKIVSLFEKLT